MKQTRLLMGMPITIEIVGTDKELAAQLIDEVFLYFAEVDDRYSTYKTDSEISQINRGLPRSKWSGEMKTVLGLCEQTKQETDGYFDITKPDGQLDPSGLVKGWAIQNASDILKSHGLSDFYVEAGGDVQVSGHSGAGAAWTVGIRNPLHAEQIVKTIAVSGEGVATSGTYLRGQHIYNPHQPTQPIEDVLSLTVIGPDIYNADRFATAAFAMGGRGIHFIESLAGYEGYMIGSDSIATMTGGFERYVVNA